MADCLKGIAAYVGTEQARRNEAGVSHSQKGQLTMTTFDKREEAFEKKYALDEEAKFKAQARRNRMLGGWVAEKLGLSAEAANDYAKTVIAAEFGDGGDANVIRKVTADLAAKGIAVTDADIRLRMAEFMAQALVQIKAGV
jgi:hypothetical protein